MKKRILTLALALVLCLSLAVPAFAAGVRPANPTLLPSATVSFPGVENLTLTMTSVYDYYG
ncbi:MAG: hypothetical protein LBT12_04855, partial [Oscillospiraceae bacterium]|nr:hypothetical protein [Oscillospiraceae bacterium]